MQVLDNWWKNSKWCYDNYRCAWKESLYAYLSTYSRRGHNCPIEKTGLKKENVILNW